ncbi:MAG: NusG domain II-containing protein [Thermosediminibacteraceae bacterium]|nr:NusG domain II-containing protein [Thermosediminibacteraceae bacterium]
MLTRGDKILIALILVFAMAIFTGFQIYGFSGEKTYAVIEVNGKEYQKISLGKDGPKLQLKVPGAMGDLVLEVDRYRVRVLSSDCPDKDCIRQGWASRPGQALVCLPNRVVVKIVNNKSSGELDGVSF